MQTEHVFIPCLLYRTLPV